MMLLMTVMHQQWARPNPFVPRVMPLHVRDGLLALIDWDAREVVWARAFDSASGACFTDDSLLIASMVGNRIFVLDRTFQPHLHLTNPLFNDLHTVHRSNKGFIVASSGTDAIIEFSSEGYSSWTWLGTDHGFIYLPDGGTHIIDPRFDYSMSPPLTTAQTTHINSAAEHNGMVLATLFVQGTLIAINKATGTFRRVVNGMNRPHAIRKRPDGWLVCDSGANRVVLLRHSFAIEAILEDGFDWPQDAVCVGANGENVIVLDANNSRLVELNIAAHRTVAELVFPSTWKGFSVEVVPDGWIQSVREGSGSVHHG